MIIHGSLKIEQRTSSVTVETCPRFLKPGVTDEIYAAKKITYSFDNATSYEDNFSIAVENVGESESCPTSVLSSTTFDPEETYGTLTETTEEYTSPFTRSSLRSSLPVEDWEPWSDTGFAFASSSEADLFAMLELSTALPPTSYQGVGGVADLGGGLGRMNAERADAEIRFSVLLPLACTVLYQIGSQFLPAFEGDAEEDFTWGSTQEVIVTDTATVTIPTTEDYVKKMRVVGIRWHPWT